MIPNNHFCDYNTTENFQMSSFAEKFIKIFEATNSALTKAQEEQSNKKKDKAAKKAEREARPNVVFVNSKIKNEYLKMQNARMPLHQIIAKYDEWYTEMGRIATANSAWLSHPKVFAHVAELIAVCATFRDVLIYAQQEANSPTPSNDKTPSDNNCA